MTSRPSTARKVTPAVEAKRKAALDAAEVITVNGEPYSIRPADITGVLEHEFRQQTGMSVRGMLQQLLTDPGLDSFAAFMYLAKTLRGDKATTFLAELSALDYSAEFEVGGPQEDAASAPEA